ncbi:hypothetical protein AVEN_72654-1 [Araneus ventricosus]|uniref:Uncharacterized protein n=1 Tax=Araneus ventricosus TaxID=182803 RepID=A0A4Y2SBX8_ARAVE|nr:hypothetical protein AVEN_72654-1 [Araneus ventricosus]
MTWNFTESGHGKGPADGIRGTVKQTADEIVACGSDINNAKTLFQCLSAANLKVQFLKLSEADINITHDLKPKGKMILSIPNLMKLHQLTWNKFENVQLQLHYLSCFTCEKCLHYSSEPSFVELSPRFKNTNDCTDSQASIPDLKSEPIIIGAWVAVVYDENWFPGLIEKINDDNLKINFMLRNGSRFYWPNIPDIQEAPKNGILCLIKSPPSPITSRYFITDNL